MTPRSPYLFTPTPEDIANIRRYQAISTEKKLAWLENIRTWHIELWKRNPALWRAREFLQQLATSYSPSHKTP